jgi:hypothetical protein
VTDVLIFLVFFLTTPFFKALAALAACALLPVVAAARKMGLKVMSLGKRFKNWIGQRYFHVMPLRHKCLNLLSRIQQLPELGAFFSLAISRIVGCSFSYHGLSCRNCIIRCLAKVG